MFGGFVGTVPQDVRIGGAENALAPAVVNFHLDFRDAGIGHERGEHIVDAVPVRSKDVGESVIQTFEYVNAHRISEFGDVAVAVGHTHGVAPDQNLRSADADAVGAGFGITNLRVVERVDASEGPLQRRLIVDVVMHGVRGGRIRAERPVELHVLTVSGDGDFGHLGRLVVVWGTAFPLRTVEEWADGVGHPIVAFCLDIVAINLSVFKILVRVARLFDSGDGIPIQRVLVLSENRVLDIVPRLNVRPGEI